MATIFFALEIISVLVPFLFQSAGRIPVKGKHLDELSTLDKTFIWTNKSVTAIFVYHLLVVLAECKTVKWRTDELTVANSLGSLVCFYVFYDFFYTLFHKALHIRALYPWIHKHHHRQKAPSRGNLDAINVHPFEFSVGEYLHLLTIYVIPCHFVAVAIFIIAGGILASLNHTRYDIIVPYGFYSVRVHDVHHRLPESNYGQYIMLWDHILGSYRPYESKKARDADGKE